jgi:MFS superfamily sulfate permease-like transporter
MSVSVHPDQDDVLGPLDSRARSARIRVRRNAAARPRTAARSWREADPATGQIVCLRLTGQLCGGTAQALLDAVGARVRAAAPPPYAVVLDLSETSAADDGARAALESLRARLANGHTRLRLVLPEGEARVALCGNGAASAIGIDALHTSVRAAILAAHAALPGPALVTPALRAMLSQPPELLLPPPGEVAAG